MQRRLAAILLADIVDFSKLMGTDEIGTIVALRTLRDTLFDPAMGDNGGTIIKSLGDGWIVEFPSITSAISAAVYVQSTLIEHPIIKLRIGVHLGEITFSGDDFYGDGINIAARLENIASAGEIIISDTAFNSLDSNTTAQFEAGGKQNLKNIDRSVQIWRWMAKPKDPMPIHPEAKPITTDERPSIAVLPFDNMSNDPEQNYFSDGLSDDIITNLSRSSQLLVIARNSSFNHRGSEDIRKIGQELGARYVLKGSVRRSGHQVRVTAQLVDTDTNNHVWADKFDRPLDDIFAIQDEITQSIAGITGQTINEQEWERIARRRPTSLSAYQTAQKATWLMLTWNLANIQEAKNLCLQGIRIDPQFSENYAVLGGIYSLDFIFGYSDTSAEGKMENALQYTQKALELDQRNERAHTWLGSVLFSSGKHEDALRSIDRALEINPNFGTAYNIRAAVSGYSGPDGYDTCVESFAMYRRLSPQDHQAAINFSMRSVPEMIKGDFDAGLSFLDEALKVDTNSRTPMRLSIAYHALNGDIEKAKTILADYHTKDPEFNWSNYLQALQKPIKRKEDFERMVSGWRLAGLNF